MGDDDEVIMLLGLFCTAMELVIIVLEELRDGTVEEGLEPDTKVELNAGIVEKILERPVFELNETEDWLGIAGVDERRGLVVTSPEKL